MKTLKLSLFIENPDNPQTVTDEAFEDLLKSVRESPETLEASRIAYCTDYVSPITGVSYVGQRVVMAGNKRLRALKRIYGEDGEVNAAYFFDLTPLGVEARRRWLVRSNIQTGEWETDLLMKLYSKDELSSLMSADALEGIFAAVDADSKPKGKKDADAIPAVDAAETPASRRGGVYMLGDSRLMCGDSTALADVLRLMGGEKADLLLTDPPYNVDYKGAAGKILNDKHSDAVFLKFLVAAFKAADGAMRDGAAFYVWHAILQSYNFWGAVRSVGWQVRECLIWVKDVMVFGRADYQWRHEPCLYGWREGAAHVWRGGRKQSTVVELIPESVETDAESGVVRFHVAGRTFQIPADAVAEVVDTSIIPLPKPTASKLHPTMKPVALFAYLVRNSTEPGDIVLDLFGGSGTTVIACVETQRRARIMELDPKFCDVIRRRWAEYVHGDGCDWKSLTPEVAE